MKKLLALVLAMLMLMSSCALAELDPTIPTASMAEYLGALGELPLHVGMMVGGGTVRSACYGYAPEDPTDYSPIHRAIETALTQGALGVSLGLGYAPECF